MVELPDNNTKTESVKSKAGILYNPIYLETHNSPTRSFGVSSLTAESDLMKLRFKED